MCGLNNDNNNKASFGTKRKTISLCVSVCCSLSPLMTPTARSVINSTTREEDRRFHTRVKYLHLNSFHSIHAAKEEVEDDDDRCQTRPLFPPFSQPPQFFPHGPFLQPKQRLKR